MTGRVWRAVQLAGAQQHSPLAIGSATAQEQGPPPGGARRQVLLPLGNAQYVKLSSGKRITSHGLNNL